MTWIIIGLILLFLFVLFGCAMWISGLFLGDDGAKWIGVGTIILGILGITMLAFYGIFIH